MMTEPPINNLLKRTENRYTLAVEAAKRARQLIEGDQPLYDAKDNIKPLAIAIEEINRGLLTYDKKDSKED
ncbi:MAG: DNA-directed RNA polymerase subunit omega [Clostridia bacterium]|nr:DNA-directed RNA polymerase subunit omega [Clostridia bacterium]MBQ9407907.1 DNA-directed RNA polymerase subunit omega [Clostridia bacterium]